SSRARTARSPVLLSLLEQVPALAIGRPPCKRQPAKGLQPALAKLDSMPGSRVLATASAEGAALPIAPVGRYRWRICALLFFATPINYVDRQVLGVLAPHLQQVIGWSEVQYGYVVTAFQGAYALGLLLMGAVIDRIGVRLGYALAILIWSV